MKDLNLLSGEKGSTESYEGPWNGRYSGKNFWENPPISTLDKDVKMMRIRMKMYKMKHLVVRSFPNKNYLQ